MRLGQLARKLGVKPVEIVEFLATKNIEIENGGNTKIEDHHLPMLIEKFAPGGLELTSAETQEAEVEPEFVITAPSTEEAPAPIEAAVNQQESDQKIELIKAPKIELSGLKVLGKIDLPEPKKKESPAESTDEAQQTGKPRREYRDQRNRDDRRQGRPSKNPIVLQREKEAREAEAKKLEQAARDKERKTLTYMKKMNSRQPTKAVKNLREVEEEVVEAAPSRPEPKTAWGRFMRWLNT